MKQIYDMIPNDKILHLKVHRSAVLCQRSKCYPATSRKFCVMLVTNYQSHTELPYIGSILMDIIKVARAFKWSIEKWHIPVISVVYI